MNRHPLTLLSLLCLAVSAAAETHRFYVGTYTGGDSGSKGIYAATFDSESGALSEPVLVAETPSPSFLALAPGGKFLYAVNESGAGSISAFRVQDGGAALEALNTKPSDGAAPCHVRVSENGKFVLFANYTGGSAGVYAVSDDGSLGDRSAFVSHAGPTANPKRQTGPHAHCIMLDAANRFAAVADLGLDKVFVYAFDAAQGSLTPAPVPFARVDPVSGPRHFAFHPSQKFAYVVNEISLTVTAFRYDPKSGVLTRSGTVSTLPDGADPTGSTAEIFVHPNGKFVYASNRGHDSIAVFSVDPDDGSLTQIQVRKAGVNTPRNFAIAPGGRFLLVAGQSDNAIAVLSPDPETGKLAATGHRIKAPSPVCIEFAR